MPIVLTQAARSPGTLVAAEGISVKETVRALRTPRASVSQGTKLLIGSLVLHPDRLLAAVSDRVIVDTDFRDADGHTGQLVLATDGIRVHFDVGDVLDEGSGSVEVHYRLPVDPASLAVLHSTDCSIALLNADRALLKGWRGTHAR